MNARQRARAGRTLRSTESGVSRRHGTETATAGRPGGSRPVPAVRHEPTEYERAAEWAYAERRREQRCPDCGREEAGGSYCTGCNRPVHPDEWTNDTAMSRAGQAKAAARRRRPPA